MKETKGGILTGLNRPLALPGGIKSMPRLEPPGPSNIPPVPCV